MGIGEDGAALASGKPPASPERQRGVPAEPGAALLAGIAPRDGVEAALAAQMAACHEAALSCLRGARREELPESARTAELRTGARLMTLFTRQLGALERYRTHLRQEREVAERAERDAALRRKFAEADAEREAEEAVIYPERVARRRAIRAALAGAPGAPATDEMIVARLARRFERRANGQGDEAEDDGGAETPPAPEPVGAAVPPPPAAPEARAPEPPLNRQQRRALERLGRKQR